MAMNFVMCPTFFQRSVILLGYQCINPLVNKELQVFGLANTFLLQLQIIALMS